MLRDERIWRGQLFDHVWHVEACKGRVQFQRSRYRHYYRGFSTELRELLIFPEIYAGPAHVNGFIFGGPCRHPE